MRIAVISDVHGNMTALEAVVADRKTVGADLVVHGGDLAANGSRPDQVIDSIQAFGWRGVRGNTDEMLWRPELYEESLHKHPSRRGLRQVLFSECAPATRELVGDARLDWLRTQPTQWQGNGVAVMHASPDDLWRAPLIDATDAELIAVFGSLRAETVVYGHIHRPFVRRLRRLVVANSGSVSLSYDGDTSASYAVYDDGSVTVRRVAYDVEQEIRELHAVGYPRADLAQFHSAVRQIRATVVICEAHQGRSLIATQS
jgi:putative phosphoesterase